MMRSIGFVLFGLLTATGVSAKECQLQRLAQVDMTPDTFGLVTAPLKINDQSMTFLIDTGARANMITASRADQLGLRRYPIVRADITFFGGHRIKEFVTPRSVQIDRLSGNDIDFGVLPAPMDLRADGIIGLNLLVRFDADFDFKNGKLSLFSQDHCSGQVVYWTNEPFAVTPISLDEGHIQVSAVLDGKTVTVLLDTGASVSIMSSEKASRLFGDQHGSFQSLSFEGLEIKNPDIELISDQKIGFRGGLQVIVLGMGTLRQLHLYFAFGERKLYLTSATAQ